MAKKETSPESEARGRRLRALRDRAGLTQVEAAALIGVSPTGSVSRYESGAMAPSSEVLMKMAEAYKTTAEEILRGASAETIVERDDALSPYPEFERYIAEQIAAGTIAADHVEEIRGVRYGSGVAKATYDVAKGIHRGALAREAGRALEDVGAAAPSRRVALERSGKAPLK